MTLVSAILNDNENLKLAACAYLGNRCPELVEIIARQEADNISMRLNY
jgi:hypothetical protein